MSNIVFVTGGARSGKSTFAENFVKASSKEKVYVATAIPFDNEMKMRVELHKEQRGNNWLTIEAYSEIASKLEEKVSNEGIILLDCLTNLISNQMIVDRDIDWDKIEKEELFSIEKEIKMELEGILKYVKEKNIDLVVVSNELGMGLVPPYSLGRHFRDIAGRMNQYIASEASEAHFVVSGIPMKLK